MSIADATRGDRAPLVTAVVAAYNAADTIGRALDSIRAQSYRPIEIVVVDDASTDGTAAAVQARGGDAVRLVRLAANRGPSAARNAGIEAAQGEFVAFLDADDEWLRTKIEKQVAAIAANPRVTIVACDGLWYRSDGAPDGTVFDGTSPPSGAHAWKALLEDCFVATPCVLARRSTLVALGGFDTTLLVGEDQDLWIRLAMAGELAYVPEALVGIHMSPGSFMSRHARRQADYLLPMIERHVKSRQQDLSRAEINRIIGRRCAQIGRNLCDAGDYRQGVALVARAMRHGYQPMAQLAYLGRLLPPARWIKHRLVPQQS